MTNPTLDKLMKEFDAFMLEEYGKWKIGRVEVKDFIRQAYEAGEAEGKKQAVEALPEEIDFSKKPKNVRRAMDDGDIGFMNGWNDCLAEVRKRISK